MPSPADFFARPAHARQRRYELLRAFFLEGRSASEVARQFGYSPASVYALTRDFRHLDDPAGTFFLPPPRRGRPARTPTLEVRHQIVALRKRNLSVPDIKARLDAATEDAPSERIIHRVLSQEGFARLPRRTRAERQAEAPLQWHSFSGLDLFV